MEQAIADMEAFLQKLTEITRESIETLKTMQTADNAGLVPDVAREGFEMTQRHLQVITSGSADLAISLADVLQKIRAGNE